MNAEEKRESKKNSKPEFIKQFIPEVFYDKKTWLDCASGDGYMVAEYFLKKSKEPGVRPYNYIGIDKNEKALENLKAKGCRTVCLDLETGDIKKEVKSVDIILSIDTLEHLEEATALRLMEDFVSILNKDGMMIITFPIVVYPDKKDNKHQPSVEKITLFDKKFNYFYGMKYKKSHVLIFNGRK